MAVGIGHPHALAYLQRLIRKAQAFAVGLEQHIGLRCTGSGVALVNENAVIGCVGDHNLRFIGRYPHPAIATACGQIGQIQRHAALHCQIAAMHTSLVMRPKRLLSNELKAADRDRKSTRLNSSHSQISYAVFCLKKKKKKTNNTYTDITKIASPRKNISNIQKTKKNINPTANSATDQSTETSGQHS